MTVLFVIVFVLVVAAIAMLATGHFETASDPAPSTRPEGPDGDLNFDVTFRGYRMDEVDAALAAKDAQIAALKADRGE